MILTVLWGCFGAPCCNVDPNVMGSSCERSSAHGVSHTDVGTGSNTKNFFCVSKHFCCVSQHQLGDTTRMMSALGCTHVLGECTCWIQTIATVQHDVLELCSISVLRRRFRSSFAIGWSRHLQRRCSMPHPASVIQLTSPGPTRAEDADKPTGSRPSAG